jgi:hypothetical protein
VKRVGLLVLSLGVLAGCKTAHDVAVSSFHVLDAPANYVRHHIDGDTQTTTTTTTTTASSDSVTSPGRTVTPATTQQRPTTTAQTRATGPKSSPPTVTEKPRPSPSPSRNASTQPQYPTAKQVPGKPGYVFSPFDPSGGYVDVTGYSSGQKVKDPYSGKIFLVP